MHSVLKGFIRRGCLNLTCWYKSLSLYALFFILFKYTTKWIVFSERRSYKATQFLASQQSESLGPCASSPYFSTLFDGSVEVGTSDSSWAEATFSAEFQKPPHMTDPTNNTYSSWWQQPLKPSKSKVLLGEFHFLHSHKQVQLIWLIGVTRLQQKWLYCMTGYIEVWCFS